MILRTSGWAAALLLVSGVQAFKDASPFFLLSSHSLNSTTTLRSSQVSSAKSVEDAILGSTAVRDCKADVILIRYAGVKVEDLQNMPKVRSKVDDVKSQSGSNVVEIPEVVGSFNILGMHEDILRRCGADKVQLVDVKADAKSVKDTESKLAALVQSSTPQGKPYVLIFTGSSTVVEGSDVPPYEMDESHPELHMDLKRDIGAQGAVHLRADKDNGSTQKNLPLFETYQFLTPGIFMGLSISLVLLLILYVGISAISGLEVSYAAFSKEMGPQAQKKQQ